MRFLFLIVLLLHSAFASLIVTNDKIKFDDFKIFYHYDKQAKLTIEDVAQLKFPHTISSQFAQGYRPGKAWFKIVIENQSKLSEFVLVLTEPIWTTFNLYIPTKKGWVKDKNGLEVPLKERTIHDTMPAFYITIHPGERKVFYCEGQTLSSHIGAFELFTHDEYFRPSRMTINSIYTFYLGILSVILLFNIFLFFMIRERLYAYYVAYLATFILFIGVYSALYLHWEFSGWSEGLHTIGALLTVFMVLFSGEFLELKERLPRIYHLFQLFAAIFTFFTVAIAFNLPYGSLIFNLVASIFFTLLIVVAIRVWRQGYLSARYYLVAVVIYMISMGFMTFTFNALIENTDFSRYAFLGGAFIEILCFSLILGNRYHAMQADKIAIQMELIHEKEQKEHELATKVAQRTDDLLQAYQNLEHKTKELEEVKVQLTHEATTDPLSSLFNRRYFAEVSLNRFKAAQRYNHALSVMMIDIDMFKNINDTYGHAIGDKVIQMCAKVLKVEVRESDIVARYGGEEFIVLLPEASLDEVIVLAQRIQACLKEEYVYKDHEAVTVTVSIGIAQMIQDQDKSIEAVIKRADDALYKAKDLGRDSIEY